MFFPKIFHLNKSNSLFPLANSMHGMQHSKDGFFANYGIIILLLLFCDRKQKLEEIATKFKLQVRGSTGEHSDDSSGVFDISNKRRLGLTEIDALKEMQNGILELIKMEKSMK